MHLNQTWNCTVQGFVSFSFHCILCKLTKIHLYIFKLFLFIYLFYHFPARKWRHQWLHVKTALRALLSAVDETKLHNLSNKTYLKFGDLVYELDICAWKNRKLNKLGDVIGERLCWPSKWARLLSLDFSNCTSAYQLFLNKEKPVRDDIWRYVYTPTWSRGIFDMNCAHRCVSCEQMWVEQDWSQFMLASCRSVSQLASKLVS